jgi:hypothetical protein
MTQEEHEAHKAWVRDRYKANPDQFKGYAKKAYKKDPESWMARVAKYYEENREEKLAYAKGYREANSASISDYLKNWRSCNKARVRALTAKYDAAKLQRTVPWADDEKIAEIYEIAKKVTAQTGVSHHVDHVIPIQGKNVSGLHHQDNLRVIPWSENRSKSNKFEPGALPPRAGIRAARKLLKETMDECRFTERSEEGTGGKSRVGSG